MKNLLLLICMLCTVHSFAQILNDRAAEAAWPNSKLVRFANEQSRPQYFAFKDSHHLQLENTKSYFSKYLLVGEWETLKPLRSEVDALGLTHHVFQQEVHGIPVVGGRYTVHAYQGKVTSMHGELYDLNPDAATMPVLSPIAAVERAIEATPADHYAWQELSSETQQPLRPAPSAELVWAPQNLDFKQQKFQLAYAVEVYALKPLSRSRLFVAANNGEVIARENLLHTNDTLGVAITALSGEREITTFLEAPNLFHLRDDARNVEVFNMNNGFDYFAATAFTDTDNFWNNVNSDRDEIATDAHWASEVFYDLLLSRGRNSIDNNGHPLDAYIHYDFGYGNAFWDGSVATFGDGDTFGGSLDEPLITIDIVGHEFTHGLVQKTADLIYVSESGALNESFADIFGVVTKITGRGVASNDWLIGSEATSTGEGIRSFIEPNYFEHPDTYGGDFWSGGNGVHTNSSVQNHWYYLLSEGGSDTNELGTEYDITGIGWEDAFDIAYRNLTVYLSPSSTYEDAAFYANLSARELFGDCSEIIEACGQAWNAVGLGVFIPDTFTLDMAFTGSTCELPSTLSFNTGQSSLLTNHFWDFGDGTTSTEETPTHTYNEEGVYDVTLIASDCEGSITDTLVNNGFVNIEPDSDACDTTIMVQNGSLILESCGGFILDPGGNDNHDNNENSTLTLTAAAGTFSLSFLVFQLESGYDYLYLYDGEDTSAPLIGQYSGSTLQGTVIESTGSSITLVFTSDGSVTYEGFVIQYTVSGGSGPVAAGFETSNTNYLFNEPVVIENTSENLVVSYDFGDGTVIYGESEPTHAYLASGTFIIQQIVGNCFYSDTTTQVVTIAPPGTLSFDPEEICITLETGTDSLVLINLINESLEALYYDAALTGSGSSWSSLENANGIIPPGSNTDLQLLLDATDLYAGTYTEIIELMSGDGVQPFVEIPVKLIVTGEPVLQLTPDTLQFGTAFVGVSVDRALNLENIGTDTLFVNDIVADLATEYSLSATNATIPPGEGTIVVVTFNPTTIGDAGSLLTITSNTPDAAVTMQALAIAPPLINVTPDSLCVSLPSGTTLDESITIFNEGSSDLNWTLTGSGTTLGAWIIVSEEEGTTTEGNSTTVDVIFDANGLLGGIYLTELYVNSNDPNMPQVVIPVKMIVEAAPLAQFSLSPEISCDGLVFFTDESLNDPDNWSWDFGDGSSSVLQNPIHTYSSSGTYIIQLTVCNELGCQSVNNVVVVNLEDNFCEEIVMDAFGSMTTVACTGTLFDNGGSDGDYTNNVDYTVTIQPPGSNSIELTINAFDLESCCDYVRVYDGPDEFSPIIGTYYGGALDIGDVITSSSGAITINFDTDGSVVYDGFEIQWRCLGQAPMASFTMEEDVDCPGTIQFNNASVLANTYSWDFGDGFTSDEVNPIHYYSEAGDYEVRLAAYNDQGEHSEMQNMSLESVAFDLTIEAVDTVYTDTPIIFTSTSATDLQSYEWDLANGETASIANPVTMYSTPGLYHVALTAMDANGCHASVMKAIQVVMLVATEEPVAVQWHKIYPNPVNDQLTIEVALGKANSRYDFELRNALGQRVLWQKNQQQGRQTYDLERLPVGIYWVYLYQEGQAVIVEKVMVVD